MPAGAEDNVELRLKVNMGRRVKKLKKLRRRMRLWGVGEVIAIGLAVWPLVTRVFLENLPFFSEGGVLFGSLWAQVLAMVAVGFVGALLSAQQYKRDKDKYDRLRAGTREQGHGASRLGHKSSSRPRIARSP